MAKFIYTGIHVADLERSVDFYTKELGMKLLFKSDIKETGGRVAWLRTRGSKQVLELDWYPQGYEFGGASGLDHLAFEVRNVNRKFQKLAENYEAPIEPFEEGRWLLGYIKDPDGNWIELGERIPKEKMNKKMKQARASSAPTEKPRERKRKRGRAT